MIKVKMETRPPWTSQAGPDLSDRGPRERSRRDTDAGRGSHAPVRAKAGAMWPQAQGAGGTRSRRRQEGPSPEPTDGVRAHAWFQTSGLWLMKPPACGHPLPPPQDTDAVCEAACPRKHMTTATGTGGQRARAGLRGRPLGFTTRHPFSGHVTSVFQETGRRAAAPPPQRSPRGSPGMGPSTDLHAEPQTSAILGFRKKSASGLSRNRVPPALSESHCRPARGRHGPAASWVGPAGAPLLGLGGLAGLPPRAPCTPAHVGPTLASEPVLLSHSYCYFLLISGSWCGRGKMLPSPR